MNEGQKRIINDLADILEDSSMSMLGVTRVISSAKKIADDMQDCEKREEVKTDIQAALVHLVWIIAETLAPVSQSLNTSLRLIAGIATSIIHSIDPSNGSGRADWELSALRETPFLRGKLKALMTDIETYGWLENMEPSVKAFLCDIEKETQEDINDMLRGIFDLGEEDE